MILAGDIGGTNTRLALFDGHSTTPLTTCVYASGTHAGLEEMVDKFLGENDARVEAAAFGVAGPVFGGRVDATNLAWPVDGARVAHHLGLPGVALLNDLEANALGIECLADDDFEVLQAGAPDATGNAAVISAGTGLGQAGMYWDGQRYHVFATEGGHADFAPRNELEERLRHFLAAEFGHVSYERVCSGQGLANVYRFLTGKTRDPAEISEAALAKTEEHAIEALDLVVSIYGSQAGNLALTLMATGGVYLGGGIAPKILPTLHEGGFLAAFNTKGRLSGMLARIPVRVIVNDAAALLGAALFATRARRGDVAASR